MKESDYEFIVLYVIMNLFIWKYNYGIKTAISLYL